jgi:WW domain
MLSLGLANDIEGLSVIPDYRSPTADVYTSAARALIRTHKHLLILNCKREAKHGRASWQQRQVYSLVDQGRFLDPTALVSDGPNKKPRKSWVRLPPGWERKTANKASYYYNHNTQTSYTASPLAHQAPVQPQPYDLPKTLPDGWSKSWDNCGRTTFTYSANPVRESREPVVT